MLNTKAKLSNKFNWLRLSRNIHPYSWCSFLKCNKYYDDPVTGAGLFTSMVGRWQSSSWLQCLLVANLTLLTVTAATTLWEQWDTSCPSLKNLETKCIWSSTTFVTICRVPYLRASFSGIEKVLCIWVRVRVGDRVQIRDQVRVHVWFQPGVKSGSVLSLTLTLTRVQNQTQNGVWTIAVKALCNCISPGPDPSPNSQLESWFVSGSLLAPCGPSEGDIVLHGPSTVSMATWHHAVHLRSKGVYSSLSAWCCGIVQFLCTSKGC